MKKFYRVIKENFLWEIGAIVENTSNGGNGYDVINDIWKKYEEGGEHISDRIVEKSPEYFERVYEVNLLTKVVYKTKEQAKDILSKEYK